MQGRPLTSQEKQKFLASLQRARGNVSKACKAISISRTVAYDHKKTDADFSEGWDQVEKSLVDEAEQELHVRSVKGWREPVFYKGDVVGHVIKKSDRLLEFYLKGNRPEKYRDRLDLSANVAGSLDVHLQSQIDKVYADGDGAPDISPGIEVDADIYDQSNPIDTGPSHAGNALGYEDDRDGESGGGA